MDPESLIEAVRSPTSRLAACGAIYRPPPWPLSRDTLKGAAMYVYIQSEPGLWTVGFYRPDDGWYAESDWKSEEEAAARVHYLNGGKSAVPLTEFTGPNRAENIAKAEDAERLLHIALLPADREVVAAFALSRAVHPEGCAFTSER